MEGRLPGVRGLGSPTGGWKPPLLQPTAGSVNSEMHPLGSGPGGPGPELSGMEGAIVAPAPRADTYCVWPRQKELVTMGGRSPACDSRASPGIGKSGAVGGTHSRREVGAADSLYWKP